MAVATWPEAPAAPRHLLGLDALPADGLAALLDMASVMKRHPLAWRSTLDGRVIACVFEQPSTRSRVSLAVAVHRLGALPVMLETAGLQSGTLADAARTLSACCDAIVLRTPRHRDLLELAEHASVPVVNARTDREHPCRALAACLMLRERFGDLRGLPVAYLGGSPAVGYSLIEAAILAGLELRVVSPLPDPALVERAGQTVRVCDTPREAAHGAAAVLDGDGDVTADHVADLMSVQQAVLRALVTGDWEG
jgi:ornithine carbamoyltransferase